MNTVDVQMEVLSLMDTSFDANGCPCFLILPLHANESEVTFPHVHDAGRKCTCGLIGTHRFSAVPDQELRAPKGKVCVFGAVNSMMET